MIPSSSTLLNPQPSHPFSFLPTTLSLFSSPSSSSSSSSSSCRFFLRKPPPLSLYCSISDDLVIGDCVVFEDDAFDDPFLLHHSHGETLASPVKKNKSNKKNEAPIVPTENLVPDKWREIQAEINFTKKERRKIAREMEFGTRVEKRTGGLAPLKNVNLENYLAFREAKLAQLKPLVLDNPKSCREENGGDEEGGGLGNGGNSSGRVSPRNPRRAVYGKGFDHVTEFFNGGKYDPAERKSDGPRKLFSKEEKVLLNKRIPDLETATSEKWLPLHTLAASGAFYLVDTLMKHNVDINAVDKDGWSAIHKAIVGKKQAITNYLLRESANPFVCDKDGATLMHYAVRAASSQAIKTLLLYNVDINLQDNDGWTPLHLAVQARRIDVVKLLLIKGGDKTLKNKDGLTPLDLCLYSGGDTRTYELIRVLKLLPKQR